MARQAKGRKPEMRARIEDIRRRELVEAALETLRRFGYSGTTVARVGAQAGMSPGIVHHYFKNKAELLESALRYLQGQLGQRVAELLRRAVTPRERLRAVIDGNFAPGLFTGDVARVWMAFLGEVPFRPENAKLQAIIHWRLRSNLMPELRRLLPEGDAEEAAFGIRALIDGFWMQCAIAAEGFSRERALGEIDRYLAQRVPDWPCHTDAPGAPVRTAGGTGPGRG